MRYTMDMNIVKRLLIRANQDVVSFSITFFCFLLVIAVVADFFL